MQPRTPPPARHLTSLSLLLILTMLVPGAQADHPASVEVVYEAQLLWEARLDTGALGADWTHRPVWEQPATGKGIRVAVIDTGIDATHPDLVGKVVAWRDFLEGRPVPYDDDTHGTHVAGIIAGGGHLDTDPFSPYFATGARGVAPDVELIIAKAMDADGNGDSRHVANAIRWALDPNGDGDTADGAHVINLSIGVELPPESGTITQTGPITIPGFGQSSEDIRLIESAVRDAVKSGAVVVVASGNHGPGESDAVTFPGTMDEVITVGATARDGRLTAFSNHGTNKPDVVAPGVLVSAFPTARDTFDGAQDGYLALGGTSMAAPFVAGTIALMMENDPTLAVLDPRADLSGHTERVRTLLRSTAAPLTGTDLGAAGAGLVQVDAALAAAGAQAAGTLAWIRIAVALSLIVVGLATVSGARRRRSRRRAILLARREVQARALARAPPTPPAWVAADAAPGSWSPGTDPLDGPAWRATANVPGPAWAVGHADGTPPAHVAWLDGRPGVVTTSTGLAPIVDDTGHEAARRHALHEPVPVAEHQDSATASVAPAPSPVRVYGTGNHPLGAAATTRRQPMRIRARGA